MRDFFVEGKGYVKRKRRIINVSVSTTASVNSEFEIKEHPNLIGSMGNCLETTDDTIESPPRGITVDATPIKECGLPIIFIIGGPGVGKRTIGVKVAEKYGFHSIVTTDIIRHELTKKTERAVALARLISQGRLVPTDVLVELITRTMIDNLKEKKLGFIVSGFPREKSQCSVFDKEVRPPDLVLFLDVRDSVLRDRLMARSVLTTSRMTITFDNIQQQIKEFEKRNKPILKHYTNLLVVIDAEYDLGTIVFNSVCTAIDNVLANLEPGDTDPEIRTNTDHRNQLNSNPGSRQTLNPGSRQNLNPGSRQNLNPGSRPE